MIFDRFCGMASAAAILLIFTLNAWLGLWGPVWQAAWKVNPSDALGLMVAIVGWIVILGIRSMASGIAAEVPARRAQLLALADERDSYAPVSPAVLTPSICA